MRAVLYERLDPLGADGDAMLRLAESCEPFAATHVSSLDGDAAQAAPTEGFAREIAPGTPRLDAFLAHPALHDAARKVMGRPLVRPIGARAHLLVPGQSIAIHTDVASFRGLDPETTPAWLRLAAHHSRLFERWRIAVATGIAWFGACRSGGDFLFYPEGGYGCCVSLAPRHDTAIVLDLDGVFHGVDRVGDANAQAPALEPDATLRYAGGGRWRIEQRGEALASYPWHALRFALTWKAQCYRDEAEARRVAENADALEPAEVREALAADLRRRGALAAHEGDDAALALASIETYVQGPPPGPTR